MVVVAVAVVVVVVVVVWRRWWWVMVGGGGVVWWWWWWWVMGVVQCGSKEAGCNRDRFHGCNPTTAQRTIIVCPGTYAAMCIRFLFTRLNQYSSLDQ